MTEDDELKARLRTWRIVVPDDDASGRLIAAALSSPQRRPVASILGAELVRALSDWRYALPYKAAAAAACLVLGVGAGLLADEPVDVAGVALLAGR